MCKKLRNLVKNKKKGFTLVELLVVIAIIIVLMAMLIPALTKYLADANKATDKANARAAYAAAAAWATNEMATKGEIVEGILDQSKIEEYFGNPAKGATLTAYIEADGAVRYATYQRSGNEKVDYPDGASGKKPDGKK